MSDLISRKALIEELSSLTMIITGLRAGKGVLREYMMEYRKSILQIVEQAPAVDAAELPCKLGDTVYQTDGIRVYESTIGEITLTARHSIFVTENIAFDERAIGETIYLTREAAEAAINKKEKENV